MAHDDEFDPRDTFEYRLATAGPEEYESLLAEREEERRRQEEEQKQWRTDYIRLVSDPPRAEETQEEESEDAVFEYVEPPPRDPPPPPKYDFDDLFGDSELRKMVLAPPTVRSAAEVVKPPPIPLPPKDQRPEWPKLEIVPSLDKLTLPTDCYPGQGTGKGLFESYAAFATNALNTRPEFNWATLCALVGCCAGRHWRVRTIGSKRNMMANLFLALVGESGTRKSLAANAAEEVMPGSLFVSVSPRSDKGFMEVFAEQPHMLWYLDEAGSLFKKLYTKNYEQMVPTLTKLYDGTLERWKAGSYEVEVQDPCLSIVSCTIEEGLIPARAKSDQVLELFTSGLMGRFLLCSAPEVEGAGLPREMDDHVSAEIRDWLTWLAVVAREERTFKLSGPALAQIEWYIKSRGDRSHMLMAGAWNRAWFWAVKLAFIYHLVEKGPRVQEIGAEHMIQALRAVHFYVLAAHQYVSHKALHTGVQQWMEKVHQELLKAGGAGLTLTELAQLVGGRPESRYGTLALMFDQVLYSSQAAPKGTRPHTVIRLKSESVKPHGEGWTVRKDDCPPPPGVEKVIGDMQGEDVIWN
jgi:hypothetical protein